MTRRSETGSVEQSSPVSRLKKGEIVRIVDGPSEMGLMMSLFGSRHAGAIPVEFTLEVAGTAGKERFSLFMEGVARAGSPDTWTFEGFAFRTLGRFEGQISTRARTGTMRLSPEHSSDSPSGGPGGSTGAEESTRLIEEEAFGELELIESGGFGTSKKCGQGHSAALFRILRRVNREVLFAWCQCVPGCMHYAEEFPGSIEQALELLEAHRVATA